MGDLLLRAGRFALLSARKYSQVSLCLADPLVAAALRIEARARPATVQAAETEAAHHGSGEEHADAQHAPRCDGRGRDRGVDTADPTPWRVTPGRSMVRWGRPLWARHKRAMARALLSDSEGSPEPMGFSSAGWLHWTAVEQLLGAGGTL